MKHHADTSTHFSSKYPLPILLVSKPLWQLLQSESGTTPTLVHLNSDPNTRWVRSDRPILTTSKPDRMSRHYRRWTDARPVRRVLTTPGPTSSPPSPSGMYFLHSFSFFRRNGKLLIFFVVFRRKKRRRSRKIVYCGSGISRKRQKFVWLANINHA